jgi:hypothetical protein
VIFFFLGVLVSLHRKPQNRSKSIEAPNIDLGDARCGHGELNKDALQQVIAAKWAVDVINAQSGSQDLKIGKITGTLGCGLLRIYELY